MKQYQWIALLLLGPGLAFGQGSLTPPGTPAPTMKTLDEIDAAITAVSNAATQVESRIDIATINNTTTSQAFKITKSGSYYLSDHLTVSKDVGIYISADHVSIDLNGYTLSHTSGSGTHGIQFAFAQGGTVRNGTIRGFANGLRGLRSGLVKNMNFTECSDFGLQSGASTRVINCTALNNGGIGLSIGEGCSMTGCTASGNQGRTGISANSDATISDCTAINNATNGFDTLSSGGCFFTRCVANGNGQYGMKTYGTVVESCVAKDNRTGMYIGSGGVAKGCIAEGNTLYGISAGAGAILLNCVGRNNGSNGIRVDEGAIVQNCTASGNAGSYAILASRRSIVHGCTASYNESRTSGFSGGIYANDGSIIFDCNSFHNSNTNEAMSSLGMGIYGEATLIKNCTTAENEGNGIRLNTGSAGIENQCNQNGLYGGSGSGIVSENDGVRIEGNQLSNNDYGLYQFSGGTNLVIRNSAAGNTIDYQLIGTSWRGTITTDGPISTKDAWANFEF